MSTFDQFDLHPQLVETVEDRGYTSPTPIQSALIPVMLTGRDVVGQAQTGTGKTAAFALPLLHRLTPGQGEVQGLVLAPTRELAVQVAEAVYTYGSELGVRVLPIYGGQSYNRQIRRLRKGVDVVVATPGRLLDLINKGAIDLSGVRTAVLDEADEMLSMGFIDDIEAILEATPSDRQTAFFSATLPGGIRHLAKRHMHDPKVCRLEPDQRTADTIEQRYYVVEKRDRLKALLQLLEVETVDSAVVFARTRADTFELAAALREHGHQAGAINGEMDQRARTTMLDRFKSRQIRILVGTDVAARGLDIDHITHVFNYELPRDPQVYVHRVGRTGRAGKTGTAIALVSSRERRQLKKIERYVKCKLERATLPTRNDILTLRDERLAVEMTQSLQEGRYDREREVAATLAAQGHDLLDVAAAALKAARGDQSMPAEEPTRRNTHGPTGSPQGDRQPRSHEQGMVRLTMNTGRANGTRPGHVVSSLAHFSGMPGGAIGKIRIQQKHTLVDVPGEFVDQVLACSGSYKIQRQRVDVERA